MNARNRSTLMVLTCAFLWSTGGVMIKYVPWNGAAIAGCRALVAAFTVWVYMRLSKTPIRITGQTWKAAITMGTTCLLFVVANKLTTAANAIVLQYTAPVFLLVFSAVLYGTKFRRSDVLAVVFTAGGIALFFFDQLDGGHLLGNLIAIFTGFTMGLMYLFIGNATPEERLSSVLLSNSLVALIGVPFVFITKAEFAPLSVILILLLGSLQIGIPYILYAKGAQYCPPLTCCLLCTLEPLLNPVWVMLFYGEVPGVFALIGGLIVVITITVWTIMGEKEKA